VLSTIRHTNIRLGELSGEAIMDRVLDTANDLGANVLLACVGDTAKKADRMSMWLDKIHEKKYAIAYLESAPAKGWDSRLLSRQNEISVLCSRNYSPTGTLFRTGIALKQPLFSYNTFELGKASDMFKTYFKRIVQQIISTGEFQNFAQILPKQPSTIREIDGEEIIVNFPPNFLTVTSPTYITFSFYEDNEYGFICASLIPNLKALGLLYKNTELVDTIRSDSIRYEAVTNIPGLFGVDWMIKAPDEIIRRGGAMSTSSCTTNGNIVGDFIIFLALYCYYEHFFPVMKDYYTCTEAAEKIDLKEKIEKRFAEFNGFLGDLVAHRARLIKAVFNFYYENISFINTDMQHGLTRSESPDVVEFLRETSSGSQTEVPKFLSLPEKELDYLIGLKAYLQEQMDRESSEQEKAALSEQIQKIDSSIHAIEENIKIVNILENLSGN
ncbi:MAG: hypothetical protein ACP5G0_01480, partial [Desulfomonilia bacterium]